MEVTVTADAKPSGTPPTRQVFPLPLSAASSPAARDSSGVADPLLIDCDRCSMHGLGCGDCMVTVLLGGPPAGVALDDEERRALAVLADAGLIPPLRMVSAVDSIHIVED
jgi:hypothetical protein